MRRSGLFLSLLLVCLWLRLAWAAPPRALMLVWDSKRASVGRLHQLLAAELKRLRAEGHFAEARLEYTIKVYDFSAPGVAPGLTRLGCQSSQAPYVCLAELDSKNTPRKLLWKMTYDSAEQALSGLDKQLGLSSPPPLHPDPPPEPPPLSPSPPPPPPPPPPELPVRQKDRLIPGQYLGAGDSLISCNERFRAVLLRDGNLVVEKVEGQERLWESGSHGRGCRLVMEPNGLVRIVDEDGKTQWRVPEPSGGGPFHFQVQDDGNLVLYRKDPMQFVPLWASNSVLRD